MRAKTRERLAASSLVLALAAISAPAGQASFPDGDSLPAAGEAPATALGERVRHEPAPPAVDSGLTVEVVPGGFDWADAGVGAGIALGAAGLLAGGVLVARRSGRSDRLATP